MQSYDAILKMLLQTASDVALKQVTGLEIAQWLNVEMQEVQASRVDLLAKTSDGEILHLELQSTNDPNMPIRMAEYYLRVYRYTGQFPKQIVLYVGDAKMRMKDRVSVPGDAEPVFGFRYELIDFRDLNGALMLASSRIEDNLLAILANLPNPVAAIREIMVRIAAMNESDRRDTLTRLLIISGLRRLGPTIREEARRMPVTEDILDHEVLGPIIRQGLREGEAKGLREGEARGLREGEAKGLREGEAMGLLKGRQEMACRVVRRALGEIPGWAEERLMKLSERQLDDVVVRAFDVSSFEELLGF